ncbi:MAG: hypothetical protein A2W11_14305 [Ignavibacteria bacterium RBG_16_35_7]|nr:MAG: hypothetical protein A2W11_14305 [Ignavibacteria bacterium RBG_16_35_7]
MASTVKEIAKKANVSIATVSRALNGDEKVKKDTKELVLLVAKELNYNPNIIARNFVKKSSNIVGLILPNITDEFFSEIIRGVDQITYSRGYYTSVASSHENRSIEETIAAVLGSGLVGGVVVLVPALDKEIRNSLNIRKIPKVFIGGDNGNKNFDSIVIDNYQGAFLMAEYLMKKRNYNKLAFITGPSKNQDATMRQNGFLDALKKNEVGIKNSWVVRGDFTKESGRSACEKLLKLKERPQVIFASNDMMAIGCYEVIKEAGLTIPNDIGVAGFDDIIISQYLSPPLTTVKVQIMEIGKQAANLLMNRMEGDDSKTIHIKISTELVIRNSC